MNVAGPEDVGKVVHDEERNVWYECVFDKQKQVFTWVIFRREDVQPKKKR